MESQKHQCGVCKKLFSRKDNLRRHQKEHHDLETSTATFDCKFCQKVFKRRNHLKRHQVSCRSQQSTQSPTQSNNVTTQNTNPQPSRIPSPQPEQFAQAKSSKAAKRQKPEMFVQKEQAMRGQLKSLRYNASTGEEDLGMYLNSCKKHVKRRLRKELRDLGALKWTICVQVKLVKYSSDGEMSTIEPHFRSKSKILLHKGEIRKQLKIAMEKIPSSFSDFQSKGSGWVLDKVLHLDLNIAKYKPLKGSSYLPLPSFLDISQT